ncbi:cell envelope integrity EipB family protein [Phyllobacterium sp. 21LDTY02-6]|uniref:cell envelope integrity EipB family protein n=1 Tax=Phyllobacterium sp. 21LDTY02-6 TaxID=2944903 RepID=UPI0020205F5C|nr:cell envelope integrity EipB family protein [Phyllobacterium sp. 21LDTY02-6]MCO4316500.1 cell envelope integrity EipB family protein [Phyllobacterium sp. 21LDTY02-6]
MRLISVVVLGFGVIGLTGGAEAASTAMLTPHRAIYDLKLDNALDSSGITALTGRMVYEFNGSDCEGYTTNFRFVTRVDMEEQPQRVTDQQTTTFETANGEKFRFVNKTFVDQNLTKEVRGDAALLKDKTEVKLTKPTESKEDLDLSQFPTRHMQQLIEKAMAGEVLYQTKLFDGSEDANKIMATTVVIGKSGITKDDDELKNMGPLAKEATWPVSIAYFDDKERGEGLPSYRINFKMYGNGVTRDLKMDYGDFSMTGKLVNLQLFDMPKCKK